MKVIATCPCRHEPEDIPQTVIQIWFTWKADTEYPDEDLWYDRDCQLNNGTQAIKACTGELTFTDDFISWGALVSSVLGLIVETFGFFAAWKRLRWEKVCCG